MLHRSRICQYISRSSRLRFRMTASTAIASVFRCSAIEGGTTTVAARNRRPHTRRTVRLFLFSAIGVSILELKVTITGIKRVSIWRYLFRHACQLGFRRYRAEATPSDGTAPGFDAPCISSDADEVKIRAADFRTAAPQLSRVTLSQ